MSPDVDMQFQSDDDDICAGFYYAKSNARVIRFMEEGLKYLNPLIDDQMGMRRYLDMKSMAYRLSDKKMDHEMIVWCFGLVLMFSIKRRRFCCLFLMI